MKKIFNLFLIMSMIVLTLYVPEDVVEAKTLGDLKRELAQYEAEYEENKNNQNITEQEKAEIEARISQIYKNIDAIDEEMITINDQIEELNDSIAQKEEEIKSILAFTQVSNGESAYLEYAFGAQNFTDFIYRIAVSEQLTSYNNELVEGYKQDIENNKKKQQELAEKNIQLEKEQKDLQTELNKVKNLLVEYQNMEVDIETQIKQAKSSIKVYEDKGCEDDEDIRTCGTNMLPMDTSLIRPIPNGYITGYFGYRDCSDPRVGCYHKGLDMSTDGANYYDYPVYPVANGVVVSMINSINDTYADNWHCGGKRVFIQHNINGKTYTSGYWHLRRIDVKVGDTVTKDTPIAIIGGNPYKETWDGCSTGAHLHLEMSTGTFANLDYYTKRFDARTVINFPKYKYVEWGSRYERF